MGTWSPTAAVPTINYEALNLWWQMQNLPTFLQAWQVFAQNTNKMYGQNFLYFFYAQGMYGGNFDDDPLFYNSTLFGFINTTGFN